MLLWMQIISNYESITFNVNIHEHEIGMSLVELFVHFGDMVHKPFWFNGFWQCKAWWNYLYILRTSNTECFILDQNELYFLVLILLDERWRYLCVSHLSNFCPSVGAFCSLYRIQGFSKAFKEEKASILSWPQQGA